MEDKFNIEEAKEYLRSIENQTKEQTEFERQDILQTAISVLKKEF